MKQQVTNFRRFYAAIKALDFVADRDDVKKNLVHQYTNGRTDSLREMTQTEYDRCCEDLERKVGRQDELKSCPQSSIVIFICFIFVMLGPYSWG